MGLRSTLTFYQAQTGSALNAALAYVPGEAHVILAGPLAEVLSPQELRAVLAHELAPHFLLFDQWQGDYFVAAELLRALSADASAGAGLSRKRPALHALDRSLCRSLGVPSVRRRDGDDFRPDQDSRPG